MEVYVRSGPTMSGFAFDYKRVYDVRLAVQTVLKEFAKRFSLPADLCTAYTDAWNRQTRLDGNESLLQVAGNRRELTLDVEFPPSLALYIWLRFKSFLWQPMQGYGGDMDSVWVIVAEVCSTQGCIAASMANNLAYVPALLSLDPLKAIPDDSLLLLKPFILPELEPVVRTLLLFAQLMVAIAAERKSNSANIRAPTESTKGGKQLRSVIASKLQQLTDVSCCTPVLLTDPATHGQSGAPHPLPKPSNLVSLLRSAALVLKLATLTFNVKTDVCGHIDPEVAMSSHMLWPVILNLAGCIRVILIDASTASRVTNQEEQMLCAALCEHSVVTLRQGLKESQANMQRLACLRLLWATLAVMQPQLVRHEVKALGALPLLVAYLDERKPEASSASQILHLLCCQQVDQRNQHADLLARLQGVRRLSVMFCPQLQKGVMTPPASNQRPAKMSTADQEQLHDDVLMAHNTVDLVNRLLELYPLSQRPPAAIQVTNLSQNGGQVGKDSSAQQQFTAATRAQVQAAFSQRWPTPKPHEWQDIQLIFTRACFTLIWALSTLQHNILKETVQQLIQQLGQVMQLLASGHMPDLGLDMRSLFTAGLSPVLSAQYAEHPGYSGLATTMLSRLGKDCSLIPQSLEHSVQICSLFCLSSEAVEFDGQPAVALLRATTRVLHFVVPKLGNVNNLDELFTESFHCAMTALADSLSDRLLLCASLGALNVDAGLYPSEVQNKVCSEILKMVRLKGLHEAIFITLDEAMQVPTPWDEELCLATATMLYQCSLTSFLQLIPVSKIAMQRLLVKLLQQLQGSGTTNDQRLQRLLLTACCGWLRALCLESAAVGNCSAAVPVLSDWIDAVGFEKTDEVAEESQPDCIFESAQRELDPRFLLPGLSKLTSLAALHSLIGTIALYLDSQQLWHDLTQHGLHPLLVHLAKCMWAAAEQYLHQSTDDHQQMLVTYGVAWYFDFLCSASKHGALRPPCLIVNSNDVMPAPSCGTHATQDMPDNASLLLLWRRVACAAVTVLSLRCLEACRLQKKYKENRQVTFKLRQKTKSTDKGLEESAELFVKLQAVQEQIEQVVPSLHSMQQEPAWPAIVADHQPEDWPGSAPPPYCHQDLVYLSSEQAVTKESAQAIHSFYSFIWGEGIATAAAEQLVAEEAKEAAKAAAKKAKKQKQKAKARKQQALSEATPVSEPTPEPILQSQPDVELQIATPQQGSPSESRSLGLSPDQDIAGLQSQLQHMTVPAYDCAYGSAMLIVPEEAVLDEQASAPAAAAGGLCAGNAAAVVDASCKADAKFLDQLFCCPITKVAMTNPVIAADGHTYERTAIQHWLEGSSLSPVTSDKLSHTRLVPNVLVKSALAQHAQVS